MPRTHRIRPPRPPVLAGLAVLTTVLFASGAGAAVATPPRTAPSRAAGASAEAVAAWTWPVGPPVLITEPFRAPATPYGPGHRGIDLLAASGSVVVAPADGVVSFAGSVAGRGVLSIDHGDGVMSSIEPVAAGVAAGDPVLQGGPVATVAGGGHCDARCVHFGVRVHGAYVSPLRWLGGVPRAVLLPMGG
ncbi:hypothetical protein GCM10009819_05470 [Agromyces tropicus]|uniref:M23ase beta-sheet core domain-containing protein n=1 Tax=Agromyces tropicus TaxID=555371 RepID=A0ABP5FFI9_9MICO